jgi:hypothetical protein
VILSAGAKERARTRERRYWGAVPAVRTVFVTLDQCADPVGCWLAKRLAGARCEGHN